MTRLVNRAKMTTTTTGTGTITLAAALPGYQSFDAAGVIGGDTVRYTIEDGDAWEVGTGTYSASGPTLSRTALESSSGGSPLSLTGNAVVFVTATAADLQTAVDMDQGVATTDSPTFVDLTISDKIIHAGDTDTAIRFPAADTFTVETAGAERLRITPGGSVGIGTSSPAENLDIRSADSYQLALTQASVGNAVLGVNPSNILDIRRIGFTPITLSTNNTERLRITSTGDVGIGTSSPSAKLHSFVSSSGAAKVPGSNVAGFFEASTVAAVQISSGSGSPSFLFVGNAADVDATRIAAQDGFAQISASGASDYMRFDAGGFIERMRITSAGNVGIGTSSPQRSLHITANESCELILQSLVAAVDQGRVRTRINSTGDFFIDFTNDAVSAAQNGYTMSRGTGFSVNSHTFRTNGIERLHITSAGNVGIGTSSPLDELHVVGSARLAGLTTEPVYLEIGRDRTGDGNSFIDLVGDTTYTDFGLRLIRIAGVNGASVIDTRGLGGLNLRTVEGAPVVVLTNATERLRINSIGDVGIGTSAPARKVHVTSAQQIVARFESETTAAGRVSLMDANTTTDASVGFGSIGDNLAFFTGGTESLRIDSAGDVGIGTSNPQASLHISGAIPRIVLTNTDTGADARLNANFGSGALFLEADFNNEAANSLIGFRVDAFERMRIDSSGKVYIGRTTLVAGAGATLNLNHNGGTDYGITLQNVSTAQSQALTFINSSDVSVGSVVVTTTATSYNTTSDYRLKDDIQPVTSAADRVLSLNPINFAWKSDGTRVDGFLAHEVQAVIPQAVTGEKDGAAIQSIDHSKLVPLLTAALQEALQRIAALEAQLNP